MVQIRVVEQATWIADDGGWIVEELQSQRSVEMEW